MKLRITVCRAFLLVAVFVSFAACSGGTFSDPGHDESGLGGGGKKVSKPNKPATLSSGASYDEAVDKLDKIIAYCDANPTAANSAVKYGVEAFKSTSFSYITESTWTGTTASQAVGVINEFINQLE
ncbi:MAG: hypothetical protein LBK61_10935 [Spirochaetaceae bacterium]|jgi:hypothetical protein|nr:hypothetical protein [Spirochaetaceae bacterium]